MVILGLIEIFLVIMIMVYWKVFLPIVIFLGLWLLIREHDLPDSSSEYYRNPDPPEVT
jgi:hypothetical protein